MFTIGKTRKWIAANDKGFTLIEMAVVLIIIGLIIGAVVKGKDLVTSAKQKKLYSKYLQAWQLAYNSYYDRTGWVLGDDDNAGNTNRDARCGDGTSWASEANLEAQLTSVGLEIPAEGAAGNTTQRIYRDAGGREYAMSVTFKYFAGLGNYIEISSANGMASELGMTWDNIIDGQMDGAVGTFLYAADGTAPTTNTAWPDADDAPVPASVGILRLQF